MMTNSLIRTSLLSEISSKLLQRKKKESLSILPLSQCNIYHICSLVRILHNHKNHQFNSEHTMLPYATYHNPQQEQSCIRFSFSDIPHISCSCFYQYQSYKPYWELNGTGIIAAIIHHFQFVILYFQFTGQQNDVTVVSHTQSLKYGSGLNFQS